MTTAPASTRPSPRCGTGSIFIVTKFDRFARNMAEAHTILTDLSDRVRFALGASVYDYPGGTIALLADTGGLTANRSTFRRGAGGAPPHFHARASELFVVLDGALDVLVDEDIHTLAAGDVLLVPPRVPHAVGPAAGSNADVLFVFTPGVGRFDYYRLLDQVHRGPASPQAIRDSQQRFDNHYVESPAWRRARA